MFNINVIAHFRVLQQLRSCIKGDGGAQVSFIISRGGLQSNIRGKVGIGYRATKAAQIALALTLVHPLMEQSVPLYLINPGSVATRIGGAKARLTPLESARNIRTIMARASDHPSGTVFDHDGSVLKFRPVSDG
jgi:NAD(P)-dependent dehydrogenase (short-subunit alcohol dehydrogenase family)